MHTALAWLFISLLVVMVLLLTRRKLLEDKKHQPPARDATNASPGDDPLQSTPVDLYDQIEPYARMVKTAVQMIIGVLAVAVIGWQLLHVWPDTPKEATALLLDGIGVGLAAAAVVELAYTLFTQGPDEALDPLMLGLSATLLIELGKLDELSLGRAGALLLLGSLLTVLFAIRLFLAERRHSDPVPQIWWIRPSRRPDGDAD